MSLQEAFNDKYTATKSNDYVLSLYYYSSAGSNYMDFDFLTRVTRSRTGDNGSSIVIIPFSQMDPEVVTEMREKLVSLGGNPPALPDTAPAQKPAPNHLKL